LSESLLRATRKSHIRSAIRVAAAKRDLVIIIAPRVKSEKTVIESALPPSATETMIATTGAVTNGRVITGKHPKNVRNGSGESVNGTMNMRNARNESTRSGEVDLLEVLATTKSVSAGNTDRVAMSSMIRRRLPMMMKM
jgi:hypothetical protein